MTTITKRLTIGRPLTNAEVDANFENLNIDKVERDGSIPMTGNLQSPGIKSISTEDGLRIYNNKDELVATIGKNGTKDLIVEGNIEVGGSGGNVTLNGGDIEARNIYVTGRIISDELTGQYKVGNVGDVYRGVGTLDIADSSKVVIAIDTIVKITNKVGTFAVGQTVVGQTSNTTGVLTKVETESLYVKLQSTNSEFTVGESIVQSGSGGSINAIVKQNINAAQFKSGYKVKVFGVSAVNADAVDSPRDFTATKIGNLGGTQSTYYYWITQFKFATGQISTAKKVAGAVSHGAVSAFNEDNHIKLTLARTNAEYGIAVYRSTVDRRPQARLIDILGPGQLGTAVVNIIYIDYGTFSNTEWSTKDSLGAFTTTSGLIHFPLSPSFTILNGWRTMTVDTVLDKTRIKFTESVSLNAGGNVELVHNNTNGLQNAIDTNKELSLKNIMLPNGVYYTSRLNIPDDFAIIGSGEQTIIKQLPWNFEYYNDPVYIKNKGNVFKAESHGAPKNITIQDIKIDGNMVNNVRFQETESNYVLSLAGGDNINISDILVTNVVGGALYLAQCNNLRAYNSNITNGSISYIGSDLCPIYASDSSRITITNNVCENFVSPLDVSVTNIGVVACNTIRNCGSGLLVYGSGSLLSSPNLIMGPDNEYLPTPDTQDSDYNSINITINPGIDYTSPSYLYMSRGEPLHLGTLDKLNNLGVAIPGTSINITSDIFVLTKLNNVEIQHTTWDYSLNNGQPIINIITPNVGDYGRNNGYFQFRVTQTDSLALPNLSQLMATHGSSLQSDEQLTGLVYRIKATGYTYTDDGERLFINSGNFSISGSDKFYTITLNDANDFSIFTVGDVVKIFGHASTPDINGVEGTITEKITDGIFRRIKIKLPSTINLSTFTNGVTTGYITIRNTVIIAKGRIL